MKRILLATITILLLTGCLSFQSEYEQWGTAVKYARGFELYMDAETFAFGDSFTQTLIYSIYTGGEVTPTGRYDTDLTSYRGTYEIRGEVLYFTINEIRKNARTIGTDLNLVKELSFYFQEDGSLIIEEMGGDDLVWTSLGSIEEKNMEADFFGREDFLPYAFVKYQEVTFPYELNYVDEPEMSVQVGSENDL